jgi:NAD-reducing hydrogenase small subunit
MSFLDMDERLLEVAAKADLVYSPLVDAKEFPPDVDVTLVEGAVSSEEDLHKIRLVRERTKILVSLGDCAITANVPGMRNPFGTKAVYDRAYRENVTCDPGIPNQVVPALLPNSRPVHEFVKVDVFVPGCPPSADTIYYVVSELLAGRNPDVGLKTRFGA